MEGERKRKGSPYFCDSSGAPFAGSHYRSMDGRERGKGLRLTPPPLCTTLLFASSFPLLLYMYITDDSSSSSSSRDQLRHFLSIPLAVRHIISVLPSFFFAHREPSRLIKYESRRKAAATGFRVGTFALVDDERHSARVKKETIAAWRTYEGPSLFSCGELN